MKLICKASIAFIIVFLFLLSFNVLADERTVNLDSKIIDNFDKDLLNRWVVRGSKFASEGFPKIAEVKAWPESMFGKNRGGEDYRCMGIMAKFDRKGYNFIEIIPAKTAPADAADNELIFIDPDSGKRWVHDPIFFNGRAKMFDLWIWGSNFNYYIEAHFEDYAGSVHVLDLGDLLYAGWKNKGVEIPSSIPQSEHYIPSIRRLKLTKLMIWTRPAERVDLFYVYIDHMKILTDLFETRFDGDDLEDPDFLKEIWDSGGSASVDDDNPVEDPE